MVSLVGLVDVGLRAPNRFASLLIGEYVPAHYRRMSGGPPRRPGMDKIGRSIALIGGERVKLNPGVRETGFLG